MEEALPRPFGRYRLTGILGHGGMASVYRAESEPVAGVVRTVAIKRMTSRGGGGETDLQALVDEAKIWVRLHHPNIVGVVDFGEVGGDLFLALEIVDGLASSAVVQRANPLSPAEALLVVERTARALAHAHGLKDDAGNPMRVVHRDIKPSNILLSRDGEVKLTDFGIARATIRDSQTQAGFVKGSIGFLSPEQVRGDELDGRSDLFSLGCTLYALVTGRVPIPGGMAREAVLEWIASGQTMPPPDFLAPRFRELLASLMGPMPGDRPSNADEVVRRVRTLLEDDVDDVQRQLGEHVRRACDAPLQPATVSPASAPAPITQTTVPPMPAVASATIPPPVPPAVPPLPVSLPTEAVAPPPIPSPPPVEPVPPGPAAVDPAQTDLLPARPAVASPATGSTPGPAAEPIFPREAHEVAKLEEAAVGAAGPQAAEPLFPAPRRRFFPELPLDSPLHREAALLAVVGVVVIVSALLLGNAIGGVGFLSEPTPYPTVTSVAAVPTRTPAPTPVESATVATPTPSAVAVSVVVTPTPKVIDVRAAQALANARALARTGKYERAIEILYLEALRDHAPGASEDLHYHVCLYSSKLEGLSSDAQLRTRYERYLKLFPNATRAADVRAWLRALDRPER